MTVGPLEKIVAPCLFVVTGVLAVSALVLWPLSFLEDWDCSLIVTGMFVLAFMLAGFGCHCLDCTEKTDKARFEKPY